MDRPILTEKDLKAMSPAHMFAYGEMTNSSLITLSGYDEVFRWVAVRGKGYHDWAIYFISRKPAEITDWSYRRIAETGNKLLDMEMIKWLVPHNGVADKLYRF